MLYLIFFTKYKTFFTSSFKVELYLTIDETGTYGRTKFWEMVRVCRTISSFDRRTYLDRNQTWNTLW
jgi:hypothetical protein